MPTFLPKQHRKDLQPTDVSANDEIIAIKAKAVHLDEKLKMEEVYLKNNEENKYDAKAQAEEDYLNAIKQKIDILDKFN